MSGAGDDPFVIIARAALSVLTPSASETGRFWVFESLLEPETRLLLKS